ncbi:MAG: helix-turn-helix transcriptional regulator [Candidatus Nanosynbacter sp.]|nr:helix-turn-helix transcriptional regulator [Candidatus Nanosynbacter sp.]
MFRKWTIVIILSLDAETKRYSMLYRSLPGVTQKVLTTEYLKQLEYADVVRYFLLFYVNLSGERCELRVFKEKRRLSMIIVTHLQLLH